VAVVWCLHAPACTCRVHVCTRVYSVRLAICESDNCKGVRICNEPAIAQLVEHLTVECCSNQMVPGSIPGGRTYCRNSAGCAQQTRQWLLQVAPKLCRSYCPEPELCGRVCTCSPSIKLTWLVLGGDPAARSHRVEQFTAL
jgi:hypothetical protein